MAWRIRTKAEVAALIGIGVGMIVDGAGEAVA
jgi:hypothetical protein